MTAIAQQVAEFVAASAPFDTLDEDALTDLLTFGEIVQLRWSVFGKYRARCPPLCQ